MKHIATLAMALGLALPAAAVAAEMEHKHGASKAGTQTLKGEVLDMACYMAHEGKGPKHKACAQKCIDGGAPTGLLAPDGKVYLLVEDHNAPKPYEQVKKWAAEQVAVTGVVQERGGLTAIVIKSAEKAK